MEQHIEAVQSYRLDNIFAANFSITGRVQGVGFRAYVSGLAQDLNLQGEVWNTRQGGVDGFVQGPVGLVKQFLEELEGGPGRVRGVTNNEMEPRRELTSFSIGSSR